MSRRIAGLYRHLIEFVFGVIRHPWRTVVLCLLGVAAAVGLAHARLDVSTDQDQLFSTSVPFFKQYVEFTKAFPENQAAYVIIQANDPTKPPPPTGRWTAVADAVIAKLAADPDHVRDVEPPVSKAALGKQGLVFDIDDPDEVRRARKRIEPELELFRRWGERLPLEQQVALGLGKSQLEQFVNALRLAPDEKRDAQTASLFSLLANGWRAALADDRPVRLGDQVPDLAALEEQTPREKGYSYIPDPDNPKAHLLLVKLFEQHKLTSLNGQVEVIDGIRADIAAAAQPFPEFAVGLSGRPALDADELSTTDMDSRKAEVVSLTAVFVGLAIFLRSIWLAIAAELALGVGIGWTFGWATVATAAYNRTARGDLNLLSMVFLIALIGIGMDYLIQVLTRYRQEAVRYAADPGRDPRSIWAGVFKHVAAPINTACAGAAGAFLVSVFTPFRGAAELGLIAGGGLLLCLLTGYVVLPTLLTIWPAKITPTAAERAAAHGPPPAVPPPGRARHLRLVLPVAFVALLVAGVPLMRRTAFDPGLLSLQSQELPSVKLVRKLPTWFDVELSGDLNVLRQVRQAVRTVESVDHTESVIDAWENYQYLTANPLPPINWVDPTPVGGGDLSGLAGSAEALAQQYTARAAVTGPAERTPFTTAAADLRAFAGRLRQFDGRVPAEVAAQRLTRWQAVFVDELKGLLAPFAPDPPDLRTAPAPIRDHLLGTDGRYALYVWPKHDAAHDLWRQADLQRFVTGVEEAVSVRNLGPDVPPITGVATDVYHSTDQTHAAFRDATLYALGLIFLLVLLDLRSLRQTLLAISVLALGLPMLVAVMGLLHIDWNFANFFGLPILIGAGHEYGVFMVHRYNEACRDPHRPWRRWDVSDRALLLCGYVTSISFGFFWLFGHHLGLKSLGLVMALGIACIYLATVCVLRPVLLWQLSAGDRCGAAPARPPRRGLAASSPA